MLLICGVHGCAGGGGDPDKPGLWVGQDLSDVCPQAQRTAKMASPTVPLSMHLLRRPSVFMWPVSASMACLVTGPENLTILRKLTLTLLRTARPDIPVSRKRKRAGWSDDFA
jgi:hypothetical protein